MGRPGTRLLIGRSLLQRVTEQALAEHPLEACGVIAGPVGSDRPTRVIPLRNAAASEVFYEVDPVDVLQLYRGLDAAGEEPVVVYHSHTRTPAYPSATDVELAAEPGAHYLLLSTRDPDAVEVRSFRIVAGEVHEEPVVVSEDVP